MAWILDPISIATHGYIGIAPGPDYCPLPLAIGSNGYIRFDVIPIVGDPFGGGHGVAIQEYYEEPKKKDLAKLAVIAVIAIEQNYD